MEMLNENIKTTFSPDTDNIAQSDELNPASDGNGSTDSEYAKRKRANSIARITAITISVTLIGVGGGIMLVNSFVKEPTISSISVTYNNNICAYSFDVSNQSKRSTIFEMKGGEEILFTLDVTNEGHYENNVEFNYKGIVDWDITFTNGFDYKKTIISGSFTTYIEEA